MIDIMNEKFENLIENKLKIEQEKILLGGNVYKNRNFLPSLVVTPDKFDGLIEDLTMIQSICYQFSEDIVRLHADLFHDYEFDKDTNEDHPIYRILNEIAVPIVAKLSIANESAKDIKHKLSIDKQGTIYGDEYCFIAIILNEIFAVYTSLLSLTLSRKYLDESYVSAIKDRLGFLINPFYEELRQKFNVVQCNLATENLEALEELDSKTIH
jgi:hypothetical protein